MFLCTRTGQSITNTPKEVLIIDDELEELQIEEIDPDLYRNLTLPRCTKMAMCLNSLNSNVAERALYIWTNEQFVKMASAVTFEGMEDNLRWRWSHSIRQLTQNVKQMIERKERQQVT
ncbi:hypothetical protein SAY87_000276 [Trapa incisa]|uniref:Uncharacterized protein n=1 Tax=Trapa incisa TaxID=236973 RepID=A0AAN7GGG4_9MYRT|nr:hypothetical protein SAY87_000276 [Trapa incisa]